MREKMKQKPIVAVLLPITLLLGVVILIATSIGPLLNAALDVPLVQVENEEGKQVENVKSKKESEKIQLIAKEDGIFELKYDENFSVTPLDEKKKELSIPIYHKESLSSEKIAETFKKMREEAEEFYEGEDEKPEKKVACIRVMESEAKGSLYFECEKDQKQWLEIERHTSETVDVELSKVDEKNRVQQILQFESLSKALVEPVSSETPEKTSANQKQEEKETQDSVETSETDKKSEESKKQETKSTTTSEETKSEATKTSSEKKNETTDSKTETTDESEKDTSKDSDKEETKLPELGTPESYKYVHAVETKKTDASLEKLLKAKYEPEDSLMKPKLLTTSKTTKETKGTKSDIPIIIRDVHLKVKDGTSTFDSDNDPGHDQKDNNGIVRSFDQVSYLVSFSIQNKELTKKYANIKYRVIANLDNAVEVVDGVPRNNAEIANGTYIDKAGGTGAQYSEGVMESIISDTGQVFVPIFMNVYGSPHGKKLKPTIKLEIVEATNVETGELEEFNKIYDTSDLEKLETPETTVSAKPSVKAQLVKGETASNEVINMSNTNYKVYDMGVVTVLQPIAGRATGDYRGSTFPIGEISYTIKQKGTYQIGNNAAQTMNTGHYNRAECYGFAPAYKDRTASSWTKIKPVNIDQFEDILDMPHAKTQQIHTTQPSGDLSEIGVYDSGTFSGGLTDGYNGTLMKNNSYVGVLNPYTYNMTGKRTPEASAKSFSSAEIIFGWDSGKTLNLASTNKWSRFDNTFYIDSITYDGITSSNESSITYPTIMTPQGTFAGGPVVTQKIRLDVDEEVEPDALVGLGSSEAVSINDGNVQLTKGTRIYMSSFNPTSWGSVGEIKSLLMWDPSAFEYDSSKRPFTNLRYGAEVTKVKFTYGVAKSLETSPPYTKPVMKVKQLDLQAAEYNWYDTPEAAKAVGRISAVLFDAFPTSETVASGRVSPAIPVKVIGDAGDTSPSGNRLALLAAFQFLDGNGKVIEQVPRANTVEEYKPTIFDSSGNPVSYPNHHWNWTGESIYIRDFGITTKTEVIKNLYQTNEDIDIKVTGTFTGSPDVEYDSALNTTLPKGIHYKPGTSKDASGNPLPEPTPVNNLDGTTTLRWVLPGISNASGKLNTGVEVNFLATSDITQLSFKDTGYTNALEVKTVGEMWITDDPSIKDTSKEALRSSMDTFIEYLVQQIILSKDADKPFIEVGDNDPRPSGEDTSITYKIKMLNESASAIPDARLLEVLPYNGDGRLTNFSGSYTVKEISVNDSNAKISFSNSSIDPTTDPMDISGWTVYEPGVTPIETIKDAKSILVTRKEKDKPLEVGKAVELTVKIQPTGQKAGDVLVNNASMNSELNLPVNSQTVWTRVFGRDLTGYVWYDDDYDGLIDLGEDPVGDIPVKLYRTSLVDGSYVKELVKESLTGQQFIDGAGDSLIKTIATGSDKGKYKFENLPEGDYLAEFMLGDIVHTQKIAIVTKQLEGTDPTRNSKADPDDFKTPEYNHSVLEDLPTLLTGTDKVNHITDVNAGLTRLSKIRLFKYEEGTVVDDGDGILTDKEIEASTTHALEGAEFQLYKGKKDDPDTIKDENKVGTVQVTDASGWLEFPSLPPGDYTIVETKAPAGFELLKEPIEVHVPTYNYIAIVHVPDHGQTKLPFTGSTKAMRIILIAAACLLVVGMTGVFLHFRPIKVRGGN